MRRATLMRCYSHHDDTVNSQIRVPFRWENSPGVSKELSISDNNTVTDKPKLAPPPNTLPKHVSQYHEMHVTLCSSVHLKGPFLYGPDRVRPVDPFLAAYMKCTAASPLVVVPRRKGVRAKVRRYLLKLCRRYSGVRDDNLITG